jgi:hypothetical protein
MSDQLETGAAPDDNEESGAGDAKKSKQAKRPKRKTPVLAHFAECVPTNDPENSEVVYCARLDLIAAVKRVFPRFLEELSIRVFPVYERLAREDHKLKRIWTHPAPYELLPDSLKQELWKWASDFNAAVPWVLDQAFRTVCRWHDIPERRETFRWESLALRSPRVVPIGEDFQFCFTAWDVQSFTGAVYSKAARVTLEKALRDYMTKCRKAAAAHGLKRVPAKYSPENLEWFVFFWFAGMSANEIAAEIARKDAKAPDPTDIL